MHPKSIFPRRHALNLLLAAATDGRPLTDVYLWLSAPDDDEPVAMTVPADDELPAFDALSDDELAGLVRALVQREREVSARRRELHSVLDGLRSEHVARLQRRYAGSAEAE